jgi:DNA-binding NtrC family response regulator
MNVIERAMLLCRNHEIGMTELPNVFHGDTADISKLLPGIMLGKDGLLSKTLPEVQQEIMDQVERIYLERALSKTGGRINQAAQIAGIHARGLYNKMKRLGLRKEDFKP